VIPFRFSRLFVKTLKRAVEKYRDPRGFIDPLEENR